MGGIGSESLPGIGHHDLKFLVILEAKDSYQAFFSLAELKPPQGSDARAFLIWDVDGKPLSGKEAPLRLILTTDGEARQIHGSYNNHIGGWHQAGEPI